jgi:DNA polymerase-4
MSNLLRTWERIIIHADMDAFYAAVEQNDNPKLRGQPVLIGSRSGRGVVLTASYEARPFKVGSAMPMAQALKRCPQAIVVPPRFERYTSVSARIMEVFADFSPDVEALSLDEAFINMSGAEHLFGPPEAMALKLKQDVFEATGGLRVSVGVSHIKYVAKVASDLGKPDGLLVVPPDKAVSWLAPLPISRLWGAGPKTQARLHAAGYNTIGAIAATDPRTLERQFGSMGPHFHALANARDPRQVARSQRASSMGSDRTLNHDITARKDIESHLKRSAERIGRRLRGKNLLAGGVRVRLKTSQFKLLSRQCTLAEPSDVAATLYAAGAALLDRFDDPGPFRLVGLAAHSLTSADSGAQLGLLDNSDKRQLETTLDAVAEKFGDSALRRARDVDTLAKDTPDLDFLRAHDKVDDSDR